MALGRIAVWPFYFVAFAGLAVGAVFLLVWWPAPYPDEAGLRKVSGEISTVVVRGDIPGLPGYAGTGIESVYFTLEGLPGEFRYPSVFPRYFEVRDRTSVAVDVWIDPAEEGQGRPFTVWQIVEHNPYNLIGVETSVTHAEIVEAVTRVDRSMVRAGWWLLGVGAVFAVLAELVRRYNRGQPLPMP
jgi:hypothetical protein